MREVRGVTVIFTPRQEEADERILELIRTDRGRHRFVIVSNDTYVFNNARSHGARVRSVAEFDAWARRPAASREPKRAGEEKPPLSPREADRITDAYRRHLERRR